MNKSYGCNLRLNSQLNGKHHHPPLMTLCVMNIILKTKGKYQPIAVCEVKIELFTYICTQSLSKRIFNKELHIVPFWKSMLNVFLSR
jgi:hypothetical protein